MDRFFNATLRMNHLRTLAALCRLGQVRKVAEFFHVTQSAISKQIADIEDGLGEAILRREGNAVVLTPIGLRLAHRAIDILDRLESTRKEISALRVGMTGRFVLGSVATATAWPVPQAIALLKARAPNLAFCLEEDTANQLLERLQEREIDLAVVRMWQPITRKGLSSRVLMDEAMVLAVGCTHELAQIPELSWSDLMRFDWIVPKSGSAAHGALTALLASHEQSFPAAAIESTSVLFNLTLLAEGRLIGFFPQQMAQQWVAEGKIAVLPLDTAGLLSETRVFWRSDEEDATRSLVLECLIEASGRAAPASSMLL